MFFAADNWANFPHALRVWNFSADPMTAPPNGYVSYRSGPNWQDGANIGGPNHVSMTNARPIPPEEQYACGSSASGSNPRSSEVLCFRLDNSLEVLIVAPVMTDRNAAGGGDDYAKVNLILLLCAKTVY